MLGVMLHLCPPGGQGWVQVLLLLAGSEPVPSLVGSWTKELLFAMGSCYLHSFRGLFHTDILIHVLAVQCDGL